MIINYIVNKKLDKDKQSGKSVSCIQLAGNCFSENRINEISIASKTLSMRLLLILFNQTKREFIKRLYFIVSQLDELKDSAHYDPNSHQNYVINEKKQELVTIIDQIRKKIGDEKVSSFVNEINLFSAIIYKCLLQINKADEFNRLYINISQLSAPEDLTGSAGLKTATILKQAYKRIKKMFKALFTGKELYIKGGDRFET
jgi:hypothetical protein